MVSNPPPTINPTCPHCGATRWRVWATRTRADNADRFRKCRRCGHLARASQVVRRDLRGCSGAVLESS